MIWSNAFRLDVSRETEARLAHYLNLLRKWNPRINLVANGTLDDAVTRHFSDSAQLVSLRPSPGPSWVDLGSGGGFPGLVVAILLEEIRPDTTVTLIESDRRKSVFLRTVIRETGISARVISARIENAPPQNATTVSARALAPLSKLLIYVERHMRATGTAFFPKGETWGKEARDAQSQWQFSCTAHTSRTNPKAVVLEIGDLVHV